MSESNSVASPSIGPGIFVRLIMRPLAKRINPTMSLTAGKAGAQTAKVQHVGRRSGKTFITPVIARREGDTILIPLAFGNTADWVKNVRAAGRCVVGIEGEDFVGVDPEFVPPREIRRLVRRVFGPRERTMLQVLGVKEILRLRRESTTPARG